MLFYNVGQARLSVARFWTLKHTSMATVAQIEASLQKVFPKAGMFVFQASIYGMKTDTYGIEFEKRPPDKVVNLISLEGTHVQGKGVWQSEFVAEGSVCSFCEVEK